MRKDKRARQMIRIIEQRGKRDDPDRREEQSRPNYAAGQPRRATVRAETDRAGAVSAASMLGT